MKETIQQLTVKRERLKQQLKQGPRQVLHSVFKSSTPTKLKGQHDSIVKALRSAKKRKREELSSIFRLTGVSVTTVTAKRIRICLDTFYQTEYHEPYYLELDFRENGTASVHRHTLPYFIPLQELIQQKLNDNRKEFLSTLNDYLNAYVARREQAAKAQEMYQELIDGNLLSLSAFDYIEFKLAPSRRLSVPILIKLIYDDLIQHLPTRVSLSVEGDLPDKMKPQLKKLKDLLLSKPLHDVLAMM
ncbi:centromere protein O-like isoform X2 [Ptychodera flava]